MTNIELARRIYAMSNGASVVHGKTSEDTTVLAMTQEIDLIEVASEQHGADSVLRGMLEAMAEICD